MNNSSIIDLDSMLYQSSGPDRLEDCMEKFRDKLSNCLIQTNADYWIGAVGKGKCFRYNIYPLYKSNRTQKPPKFLSALKEWAIDEFNLNVCANYEADDLASWLMRKSIYLEKNTGQINFYENLILDEASEVIELNKTLCSIDKDLLNSIPGRHFNYTYKIKEESKIKSKEELTEFDFDKGWWVETSMETINKWPWIQLLMGDNSDGISGLGGVGIKTAEKWLDGVKNFPEEVLSRYISHYRDIPKAIYEYQKNYRLLHILESDEDFNREVGYIPEFPKINKIVKNNDTKIDF